MSNPRPAEGYQAFHQKLLKHFILAVQQQPPFVTDECDEQQLTFLRQLEALPTLDHPAYAEQGQTLLCRVFTGFPHLAPLVPRDLLWHFGGDCLHYMPDEEISQYQQLDEKLHEAIDRGEPFDYERERAKLFGLH